MSASDFKQIYAVKIIGPAKKKDETDVDSLSALAFDVQGTKTRWRVVRTPSDFTTLAQNFKAMSKIPTLPSNTSPSSLGKWLTSIFWLFKGRRGGTSTSNKSSAELHNLIEFVKFLHPVQSDSIVKGSNSRGRSDVSGDSSDSADSIGRITNLSDGLSSTASGKDLASDALGPISAFDDTFISISENSEEQRQKNNYIPSSPHSNLSMRSSPTITTTPTLSRRDSLDDAIVNLIPQIVQQQMKKLQKETNDIHSKLKHERKQNRNDRRSEQLLLQERYENLLLAAERDRTSLESKLNELLENNTILTKKMAAMSKEMEDRRKQQQQFQNEAAIHHQKNINVKTDSIELKKINNELLNEIHILKNKEQELTNEMIRHGREMKSINDAREREVTLRQVAENAVFEAESEIERHRVLYHRERQSRLKLQHRLTFYKQLETRLKQVAPGSMKERLSWLFDGKQQGGKEEKKCNSNDGGSKNNHDGSGKSRNNSRNSNNFTASSSNFYPSPASSSLFSSATASTYAPSSSSSSSSTVPANGSKAMTTMQSLRTMSVSELRYFLNERNIPHRDCIEKIELLLRAQEALEKEEKDLEARQQAAEAAAYVNSRLHEDSQKDVEDERASWETSSNDTEKSKEEEKVVDLQEDVQKSDDEEIELQNQHEEVSDEDNLVFKISRRSGKRRTNKVINVGELDKKYTSTKVPADNEIQKKRKKLRAKRKAGAAGRRSRRPGGARRNVGSTSSSSTSSSSSGNNSNIISGDSKSNVQGSPASDPPLESLPVVDDDTFNTSKLPPFQHSVPSKEYKSPPPPPPPPLPTTTQPPVPTFVPKDSTNQRIEERRLREELDLTKREKDAISKLQRAELQNKIQMETIDSIQGRLCEEVKQWAHKKSLIRMLVTLDKIMPRVALPTLKLRLSSTSSDVKTAYKQALRCVHPDKLSKATTEDRVRGEYVFNALREAFAKKGSSNNFLQKKYDPSQHNVNPNNPNKPVWAQRW